MNTTYIIVGVGAAVLVYVTWKYVSSTPAPPTTADSTTTTPSSPNGNNNNTPQTTPKTTPDTHAATSGSGKPKATPVQYGHVDYDRLNSIMKNWKTMHPNASQEDYNIEYNLELWNNTNTNK
jgi:hypothetical protein